MIYDTRKDLFKTGNLKDYLSSDLINDLYFAPKKVDKSLIDKKLADQNYLNKIARTLSAYKEINIEEMISGKIKEFELDTSCQAGDYKIYIIVGLDTTTIYSIKYNGENAVVLLLESTDGEIDKLNMLLAHEFTHLVRKQEFGENIFENSLGERFVTEGIGCNYAKEIAPGKADFEYCIVGEDTVLWVNNNLEIIEEHMAGKIDSNELISDYFYMFADTAKTGLPARTGYVYGYLKVKEYLEKNNLKIKDIIAKDWRDIL